jgi:hypothetical protein
VVLCGDNTLEFSSLAQSSSYPRAIHIRALPPLQATNPAHDVTYCEQAHFAAQGKASMDRVSWGMYVRNTSVGDNAEVIQIGYNVRG